MNKYEIAAAAALNALEGRWVRLTSQEQREVFGAYLFGRQEVRVDLLGQGKVEARKRAGCGFTRDTLWAEWTLDEVAQAARAGRALRVT